MRRTVLLLASAAIAVVVVCGAAWADTFTVQNTNDSGPGSLRAAITRANANPGKDVITFAPNVRGTIGLKTKLPTLRGALDIRGPGADRLTVRRSVAPGTPEFGVFDVARESSVIVLRLTVSNGRDFTGGGFRSSGGSKLTLKGVVVSGNWARSSGGGAKTTGSGRLTVLHSTFSDNTTQGSGGAISGNGKFVNSTFSGNTAQRGGAISGRWTVLGSTFSDNAATASGDALAAGGIVVNSTFSGNIAGNQGGGISIASHDNPRVQATVRNSTFTANSAGGRGGGIHESGPATFTIEESIVAGNEAQSGAPDALGTFISGGYNLIGDPSGSSGFGGTDLIDTAPRFDSRGLRNYGGPTKTVALVRSSPAVDAVEVGCPPPATDQRGVSRPQNGDGEGEALCDIGAYERTGAPSP